MLNIDITNQYSIATKNTKYAPKAANLWAADRPDGGKSPVEHIVMTLIMEFAF
jgi:hypothetical protein